MPTMTKNVPDYVQENLRRDVFRVAECLHAFQECDDKVQEIILEMTEIIKDEESSCEEREQAVWVLAEALFPSLCADLVVLHKDLLKTPEARETLKELKDQQHSFAERVRQLMDKKGLTQEQLAEATGVTQPAISNILTRNCRPQLKTVLRFAEVFGVEPGELWPEINESG